MDNSTFQVQISCCKKAKSTWRLNCSMRYTANLQYAVYQHTCSLIYDSKSNQTVRQFSSHNVKTIKTVSFCGKFFNGRWLLYRFHRIESADVCVLTSLLNKYSLKMSFSKCPNQTWDLSKNLHDRRFQGKKFTPKTRNFRHF